MLFRNNISRTVLISFVLVFSVFESSAQIEEMLSYKYMLNLNTYDEGIQETILELEENWFCSDARDSLLSELKKNHIEDNLLDSYIKLLEIYQYISKSDYDTVYYFLNQYKAQKDFPFLGRVHYQISRSLLEQHKYTNALDELFQAERIFENNNNSIELIYVKGLFLKLYIAAGNNEYVKSSYLELLTLSQQYDSNEGLVIAYKEYAWYIANRDVSLANELLKKAWKISKDLPYRSKIRFAVLYLKFLVRYELYDDFNSIYSEVNSTAENTCYLGVCSVINTLYAHKMSVSGEIDSARYYNQIALKQRKIIGSRSLIGFSFLNISNNSIMQKDYEDAKQKLDSAYHYLYQEGSVSEKRYYYQYLLKYYQAINNKDSVISIFEKLSVLDNDYYKAQQDEYISRQKAESDIRSTLENEKYLSEVKAQKLRFWYVLIITILLTIILIGILKLYHNKARSFNMLKVKSFSNYKKIRNYEREVSQLKTIFQNDITGFFILDKDKNISYVNARGEMLFKSSSDKILTKTLYEFIDDDFIEVFESGFSEMCKSGKNNEVQVKVKNNKDLWINLSISPMYVNDELESILVIAQDISSRMKALDSEKEQKKVLQTLFNSVTESIVLLDGTGIIKLINETGSKRLGKSVEQLIGVNYFQIIPVAIREERVLRIKQAINNRKADIYSENIDSYHTQVSIYPNFTENGEVDYIAEFSIDITDRSLAHEQINSLRQKVLRSQMNPHFIFNSLNAIQSYVLKNDTELAVKYLNSFARLIRMILDGSRFDYISLRKEISLLEHYLELQQLRFGDKFSWTMEVDHKIDTDSCLIPVMLAQPFIENAIEHGLQQLEGKGRVKISYVKHDEIIVFKVSDNGIGRQASMKIQENTIKTNRSLSTNIFKERLFTLNKYSGQKITYDIIDLKDDEGIAKGTMVVINIPITYKSNIM